VLVKRDLKVTAQPVPTSTSVQQTRTTAMSMRTAQIAKETSAQQAKTTAMTMLTAQIIFYVYLQSWI
jgi:hypothetical protein